MVMDFIYWPMVTRLFGFFFNLTEPMRWALNSVVGIGMQFFSIRTHSVLDIFAGILLMGQSERPKPSSLPAPQPAHGWQTENPKDLYINRFVDLAMAIYMWPSYIYFGWFFRPWTFFKTMFYLRPFHMYQYNRYRTEVVGDGILNQRAAGFVAAGGMWLSDLKYASFIDGVFQTPYCIMADKQTKSIVIVIRGSTSLEDWFADTVFMSGDIPDEMKNEEFQQFTINAEQPDGTMKLEQKSMAMIDIGNGVRVRVHTGMYLCAKGMYGNVERVLFALFSNKRDLYDKYNIVVTGHSLGAGVASLLTMMLRRTWRDRVRGYCFSPPGSIIATEGLRDSRDSIMSFVVGDDVIPRMSYYAMSEIKSECRSIMLRPGFQEAKKKAIMQFFIAIVTWPFFGPLKHFFLLPFGINLKMGGMMMGMTMSRPGAMTSAQAKQSRKMKDGMGETSNIPDSPEKDSDGMIRLYAPGIMMHLIEDDFGEVDTKWINNEDLQQIMMSSNFVPDHMAKRVRRIVKRKKHMIYYVPFVNRSPLIRRVAELFY